MTSNTNTTVYFEFLMRPGLEIHLGQGFGLGIEPEVGVLGTALIVMPQITAMMTL